MMHEILKTDFSKIRGASPKPPDAQLRARLVKLQKKVTLMECKLTLERHLAAVRESNSDFFRSAAAHDSGNNQTRLTSIAFSDGWGAAFKCVEKRISEELYKIEVELAGIVI